jgi:hypothetical protein
MARTKGARGRKNLPTNAEFKEKIALLSIQFLRRLGEIAANKDAAPSEILRAANLVVPLHYQIMQEGEPTASAGGSDVGKSTPKQDFTQKLVDFSEKKAESDKKKANTK